MTELVYHLLINLLFILISILLVNLVVLKNRKAYSARLRTPLLFGVATTGMVGSLILSVPVEEGFYYDLRFVPFLLGCMYLGKRGIWGLALVMVIIRLPLGGYGIWVTMIIVSVYAVVMMGMYPRLLNKSLFQRVMYLTFLAFIYSLLLFMIPKLFFGFHSLKAFLLFSLILTFSTFFVCYLCEVLRTSYLLQLESFKYEKMETVSHLAASISHEVRNPLTTVKGFLQLIHENPNIPREAKLYSQHAISETDRATAIISDYLTFARPHPEKIVPIDLKETIHLCREVMTPLANKQGVSMEVNHFHHNRIKGDPHKFQQALINLCKNGIEAMGTGGTLSLITHEEKEQLHVYVMDTGIGMTPEQVARLGEPYFSLKEENGTGLGFMVVFRIVEGMFGKVHVESAPSKGTKIKMSFPIYKD
ncbi:ATP-binding protein [Cytobacillus sp. FJAT-54145]|uniref:histidine kinase n=1 Tax=Cytobacillus spartinae TaxID=3299023 RepID=A0ABW6K8E3_9BACI